MKWIYYLLKGLANLFAFRREDRSDFALVTKRWQALADRIEEDRDRLQHQVDSLRKEMFELEKRLDECELDRLHLVAAVETFKAELTELKDHNDMGQH